jgi:hypothetical protein
MGAGWLYYHKYPPKRKCPACGKRHYMKRIGVTSNGADVWQMYCPKAGTIAAQMASDWGVLM